MGPWLIPLLSLVPDIAKLFSGGANSTAAVVEEVGKIAMKVTGLATPEAASSAITADPVVSEQFKMAVMSNQLQLATLAAQREKDDAQASLEAEKALTDRIVQLEGTAADLKGVPILGPLMLFLRGAQRIVVGYGVFFADYQWFSGAFTLNESQTQLLFAITLMVGLVLFGERAIKNVSPLLTDMIKARAG